jgi:hypothetical protein
MGVREDGGGEVPEGAAVELKVRVFGVGFHGGKGGAGSLFVVGFLGEVAALISVSHYGACGM